MNVSDDGQSRPYYENHYDSRALKSQYFVDFQLNHNASRLFRNKLCAFIELIFSENKHFNKETKKLSL